MTEKVKSKNKNKTPLKVFVIWHQEFLDGRKYADSLFRIFSRNDEDFSAGNIGIPFSYLTTPIERDAIEHCINQSNRVAFILLIDAKMVISDNWKKFSFGLLNVCNGNDDTIIYPVAVCSMQAALNFNKNISRTNFIQLDSIASFETDKIVKLNARIDHLVFEIAHELCRYIFCHERVSNSTALSIPSIKVFLSQARVSGNSDPIATSINEYISSKTPLKTFIDVNDIPKGVDFELAIEGNIENSVLLAICSDKYSSREWCQKEILSAKRNGCPIIILDALESCDTRRFPYGANLRVLHLGHDNLGEKICEKLVYEILIETLKVKYNELFLDYIIETYDINRKDVKAFSYPPELYTLLMKTNDSHKLILYPEPPLNVNELSILKQYKPQCIYATPTIIPLLIDGSASSIEGINIGLSVSETQAAGEMSRTDLHLATFYNELCRYLLTMDVNLIYTGNVNYKSGINFVDELQQLVNTYCFNSKKENRINVYHLANAPISDETKAEMMPCFKYIQVPLMSADEGRNDVKSNLTSLRVSVEKNIFARIVIGGKLNNYKGKYPGVVEEAYISLKCKKPLFVVGAFGGAAEQVARALNRDGSLIDASIVSEFNNAGFCLNNGLGEDENLELAFCDDVVRNVFLIIKGLKNLANKTRC